MKTAILSTIGNTQSREIARGAIRYRRLVDFISSLRMPNPATVIQGSMSFNDLLTEAGIARVAEVEAHDRERIYGKTVLVKTDGTFFELRFPKDFLADIATDWESFVALPVDTRKVIYEALSDMERMGPRLLRYRTEQFEDSETLREPAIITEQKGLLG